MKKHQIIFLFIFMACFTSCHKNENIKSYNQGINIVPLPKNMTQQEGEFKVNSQTVFVTDNSNLFSIISFFQDKIESATGFPMTLKMTAKNNYIAVSIDSSLHVNNEGYTLDVSPNHIKIAAKTNQGIFYGLQTLLQLLPAEIESSKVVKNIAWTIPCVQIEDEPAFPYRGMMLDVCRHFHDVDFVKKQLDIMAMLKMNRFHWHLTEDHLWAIEIKKYPLLTEIGSVRKNADGTYHKGFYTQDQIKEIVDYAAERQITVIPEIELPGHALAALTAYPNLSCTGGPFQLRNKWGVEEDVYCAGNEETFAFLEDVINEVIPLFPGQYFHIGGDECPKIRWKECSKCQERIKKEGLKDEHELQSYFVHRIEQVLLKHNKSMIGWDEILEGGLAPSATVMSWRGEEGGIEAATMGHDVVMSPGEWLYVDYGQGGVEVEPIAINFTTLLDKTYNYNPASEKIPANLRSHILGAQCNMWTEYATTPDYTEYLLYPRMLAVAELNWTPLNRKDYAYFEERLNNQLVRLDQHNINYHIPLPEGPICDDITIVTSDSISFRNTRNIPMVYTTNGESPNASSNIYKEPFLVSSDTIIKIASLLPSGKLSKERTINVSKRNLRAAHNKPTKPGMKLSHTPGDFYFVDDTKDAEWSKPIIVSDFNIQPRLEDKGAFCYNGYFEVPEDGVYYISTEMDELQINGIPIISNDGKLVRHTHNRSSIALEKGQHAFQLLFINNNIGGFPRIWNNKGFFIASKDGDFKQVASLSH